MPEPEPAESLIVPTDNPDQCCADYRAQGWKLVVLYVRRFYPSLCEDKQWACKFMRQPEPKQKELL